MATLNLGILAHVDAGKTTLTERLLHAAGAIHEVGRVDDGTTQTDSMELERRGGITIRSSVASFDLGEVTVNLLDTPGHPDFIAEVERVLGVLDGAVLVVSAVEGVQAQTVLLFRALRRLRVPTVIFLNKIDRVGADVSRTMEAVRRRLHARLLPIVEAQEVGTTRAAVVPFDLDGAGWAALALDVLSSTDDELLVRYVDGTPISSADLQRAMRHHVAAVELHPVLAGAALSGVGVPELLHALPTLLPVADAALEGEPAGRVFAIERGRRGEKIALVRMFSGTLAVRDRLSLGGDGDGDHRDTVTGVQVVRGGGAVRCAEVRGGEIARVHGLRSARIGSTFGAVPAVAEERSFPPPTLETAVVPRDPRQARAVHDALARLAERDPLIDLRQDEGRQELFLSLYGEVQKEVVAQTLAEEDGLEVDFRPTTPVCVERPVGEGRAIEHIPAARSPHRPFLATVGLVVSPLPPGTGVRFALEVDVRSIPIHVFDSVDVFHNVMDRTVRTTFGQACTAGR